ncbi:hypothetical protein KKE06_01960 [Candidatus Micrarchaeota archaeon]|nr:hypothetical protein [Candidatus Micrarchaeota archaeon]MBU1930610.1 hypothetical protein [Candidatus Micrarchaeota archaeon]
MGFFDIITNMDETIVSHKDTETLGNGIKRLGLLLIVVGVIIGAIAQIVATFMAAFGMTLTIFGLPLIIEIPIILLVGGLIFALVLNGVLLYAARAMGGTANFGKQFGLLTTIIWPITIIAIIAGIIFSIFSLGGPIGSIIGLLIMYPAMAFIGILSYYFIVVAVKTVHGLSTYKAALSLALAVLIGLIIVLVVGAIIGAAILAPILGSGLANGMPDLSGLPTGGFP